MNVPVVALVGRPNVGKSSLFNRVIGQSTAIVDPVAGTTRDRHFARTEWGGRSFWLVDTGGLSDDPSSPMDAEIRAQVLRAIDEADLLLMIVDAKSGLHPSDARVVDLLRNSRKPWLLVANKVDDPATTEYMEFYELGAGDPLPVSASNGRASGDLLDEVVRRIPVVESEDEEALKAAVIGRPNVGKSSLVNRLLGEDRLVVAETAGTTRDAIDTPMRYHGRTLIFIDTAGLRRKSRSMEDVEFYSALRTRRAIERADVCLLLVDATEGIHNQDLWIANLAWESGKGLALLINKWDLVEKDEKSADKFRKTTIEKAPFLRFVPMLFTSALTGLRAQKALDLIVEVAGERTRRITTSEVNRVLQELSGRNQPPQPVGRELRFQYGTQTGVQPPTFTLFCSDAALVPEHYVRYLHNGFREAWGFQGSPIRILLRTRA